MTISTAKIVYRTKKKIWIFTKSRDEFARGQLEIQ